MDVANVAQLVLDRAVCDPVGIVTLRGQASNGLDQLVHLERDGRVRVLGNAARSDLDVGEDRVVRSGGEGYSRASRHLQRLATNEPVQPGRGCGPAGAIGSSEGG